MDNSCQFNFKKLLKIFYIFLFFLISNLSFSQSINIVKGTVTDGKTSVSGAIVKWQASSTSVTTDKNGNFTLKYSDKTISNLITAWKEGFFNGGIEYKKNLKI